MKRAFLLIAALLPFAVFAQQTFTIKGESKGIKAGETIYLSYTVARKSLTDSAKVAGNRFVFKGQVAEPVKGTLYIKPSTKGAKRDVLAFYLEPANMVVKVTDSLKYAKISGSKVNADDAALKAAAKTVQDELTAINASYAKFSDEQKKDKTVNADFYKNYAAVSQKLNPIYLQFAKSHPNAYISLTALMPLATNEALEAEVEKAYLALSPAVRQTSIGQTLASILTAAKKTKIGLPAIAFTQRDVNGKPVSLSDFKGKYVLVDFWASWCGPCRKENPNVVAAYQQFKDSGFTVLGVSLDQPGKHDDWVKAIADDKLDWTHVSDLKYWDNEVAKLYGVRSIPANYLIDPNGKIVAKGLRGEELHQKLAALLNVTAKAK